jgi:hypothetical protein
MTWSSSHLELCPIATPRRIAGGIGGIWAIMVIALVMLITRGGSGEPLSLLRDQGRLPKLSRVFLLGCWDMIPRKGPI